MPHRSCSVCTHKDLLEINHSLRTGTPTLRALADQHGVSKTALLRHKAHIDPTATRMNTTEIDAIDNEIRRIQRALRKAQRSRTRPLVVNLSRELRSWIALRAKLQGAMQPEKIAPAARVSEREVLQMTMALVESKLTDPDVCAWILGLAERLRADAEPTRE